MNVIEKEYVNDNVTIRNANVEDLEDIAEAHIRAFEGFFLTLLGKQFLKVFYSSFIELESGILSVLCKGEKVIGFSAGTTNPEFFFKKLKYQKGIILLLCCFPAIVKFPKLVFGKLFKAIFYSGDTPESLNASALLSSLAVNPQYRGEHFGKRLVINFESIVSEIDNVRTVYLITDKNENCRVISFYKGLLYKEESSFFQSSEREMLRLIKYIK